MEGTCSAVRQPAPKTSGEGALKTSPAMWNTQQSTPALSASHKLQSRAFPPAAPPLLQAEVRMCPAHPVLFTSCLLHPEQPIPVVFPATPYLLGNLQLGPPQPGIFQEKKGIPTPQPSREHSREDQTLLLA